MMDAIEQRARRRHAVRRALFLALCVAFAAAAVWAAADDVDSGRVGIAPGEREVVRSFEAGED